MKSPEDLYKDKKNNKKTKPSTEQIINQGHFNKGYWSFSQWYLKSFIY